MAAGATFGGALTLGRVMADGCFLSVLTSDIIVAKMAGRELHPLVNLITQPFPIPNTFAPHLLNNPVPTAIPPDLPTSRQVALMALISTVSVPFSVACTAFYYVMLFWDMCAGLRLPLLTPCVNVYCDGVFDLCHLGHMKQFQQALTVMGRPPKPRVLDLKSYSDVLASPRFLFEG